MVLSLLRDVCRGRDRLAGEHDGAHLIALHRTLSAYLPSPKGPVFMALIERTFGKEADHADLGYGRQGRARLTPGRLAAASRLE